MRKIKAFFVALVLCIVTIFGAKGYYDDMQQQATKNNQVRYDISFAKYKSHNILVNNIDDTTLTLMGSSELSRLLNAPQHPKNLIDYSDFKYMTIGQGYFQSILHAITLGSISDAITNHKVVLFLSPQWFEKDGINKKAFASRYSEDHLVYFLQNEKLSDDVKNRVMERVCTLLEGTDGLLSRAKNYQSTYMNGKIGPLDKMYTEFFGAFLNQKYQYEYVFQRSPDKRRNDKKFDGSKIDYQKLKEDAEQSVEKGCTNNPFGMEDGYWNRNIKDKYEKLKDSHKDTKYAKSIEYDDLRLYLDIAKELGIEVELVNQPVNGPWYDYMAHDKEDRQIYYQNIRDIASEYNVGLLDLTGYEYEPYFFNDATHFSGKGWTIINEELIKFYQK